MAAITRAEIEKVVRKVLDEEQKDTAASLQAIQSLSRLLTEEVIPKLADETAEEASEHEDAEETTEHEQEPTPGPVAFASAVAAGPGARAITVQLGVRIGPTGKLLAKILEFYT